MTNQSRVSRRVGAIAPSATLAVTNKAKALRAEGHPVIGFGAGEPDFATPDHIVEAAVAACKDPVTIATGQRPACPPSGLRSPTRPSATRDTRSQRSGRCHQRRQARGVQHLPGPARSPATRSWSRLRTGRPTPNRSRWPGLRPRCCRPTKRLAFASRSTSSRPPRPLGPRRCCSFRHRTRQARSIREPRSRRSGSGRSRTTCWIITDEIYEHLVYGDAEHHSLPVVVPEIADRCVVLNGVAKTYAMTGWRVGWLIGPPDIAKAAPRCSRIRRRTWPT